MTLFSDFQNLEQGVRINDSKTLCQDKKYDLRISSMSYEKNVKFELCALSIKNVFGQIFSC